MNKEKESNTILKECFNDVIQDLGDFFEEPYNDNLMNNIKESMNILGCLLENYIPNVHLDKFYED